MTRERRVVVVGGGMAAARLAQQLDGTGVRLTIVGEEPHAPYNRVLLADVLAGRYAPEVIGLPATDAEWLRGVRALRVEREARRVVCDDGRALGYEALVLATGAGPVLPPLRGLFTSSDPELPRGVRAFRTLDDCLALRAGAGARPGTHAVVVGGGLLGVSAARALALCGARVLLAHRGEHLMERQLDPEASRLLRRHLRDLGVETHTECGVRGLRTEGGGSTPRALCAVELADGHVLEARVAVLACGVRPRSRLAREAGLDVAGGIVVDDRLRTGDPRVYAIGDCAEHDGVLYGRAGPALEQADALARVLLSCTNGTRRGNGAARGTDGTGTPDGTETPGRTGASGRAGPAAEAAVGTAAPRYPGTRALTRLTLPAPAPAVSRGAGGAAATSSPAASAASGLPLDLAAFGDPVARPDDHVVRLTDATRGLYLKVVVRDERLVGGILLGDLGAVGPLARAWEADEELPSAPLLHLLTRPQDAARRPQPVRMPAQPPGPAPEPPQEGRESVPRPGPIPDPIPIPIPDPVPAPVQDPPPAVAPAPHREETTTEDGTR